MANSTTTYKGKDGRTWIDVILNKTLVAADSGIVQNVIATGVTITLPATVVGLNFIVRNGGKPITAGGPVGAINDGNTVLTLPTGTDGVTGNAFTAAASKGANNNAGNVGDEIEFIGSGVNSAVAWVIRFTKGVWVRTT